MRVRGKYKIHGLRTVNGETPSKNTSKFYDTYQEALHAAQRCVVRDRHTADGVVIFRAVQVVVPEVTSEVHDVD